MIGALVTLDRLSAPGPLFASVCILCLVAGTPAGAQPLPATASPAADATAPLLIREPGGGVMVRATRIVEEIRIDGRLDEAVYSLVPSITGFIQQEPNEGAPATEKTEAWILYDDKNLYFACRCWDEHPERIVANDMRRDSANLNQHDSFGVQLDPFHDGRSGYMFYMSPIGGMRDAAVTDERPNIDWNAVWTSKGGRFERGWIAEIAIPFKSLRYTSRRQQTWGIQLRRLIRSKNERVHLTQLSAAWGSGAWNHMSQAATLLGLELPPAGRNLDIKPYAISRLTTDLLSRPALHSDLDPDAGVDVKYGLTKSLTADFTYNTDFAQVEADEAQVNLSRFSLSFPEKREFFLEGGGIFAFGTVGGGNTETATGGDAPTIFYSRRIGLSGARALPVIAGGRLSGRAGPWSIGALNIEVDKDAAAAAAQTNFTVARIRRDILRRSNIGGIFTRRSVSTVAPGANDVWGVDANFAFYQNLYLGGYVARSRTPTRIGHDLAYRAQFNYTADRYAVLLDRIVAQENFNPEVGFLRRESFRRSSAQGRFSPRTVNNAVIRRWTFQGNLDYTTDNDNHLESRELQGEVKVDLHSSDAVSVQYLRIYEFLPGPLSISPRVRIPLGGYSFQNTIVSFTAGQQHRMSGTTSFEVGSFYGGDKKTFAYRGRVEVSSQLGIEPNISLNWIDLPQGSFTDTVLGARTTFTVTPRMFVAALLQYSASTTSLSTNLRFRWEYHPGSELFVVYTEGRSTFPPRGTELQNRGFVIKINRLFRF